MSSRFEKRLGTFRRTKREAAAYAMSPPAGGKRNMLDDQDWGAFKRKLKAKTEIDLDLYKEPQMKRRIGSLVTRKGYDSYTKYFDMATQDKTEFDAFIEYLTINVSEFFRTPEKFSKLETDVIPDLLTRSPKLNIWSAGCSIGAEPYSLAMILKEMTPGKQHRILATDLDIEIIAKAKKGVYTATFLAVNGNFEQESSAISEQIIKVID